MMSIKFIFLLAIVPFIYPLSHCILGHKSCNTYYNPTIEHCSLIVGITCYICKEGYSVSNDGTRCINVPNCKYFNEDNGKCEQCQPYYSLDSDGKCVKDYCLYYNNDNKKCRECNLGFYLNNDLTCERISIPYCTELEGETCTACSPRTTLENGRCKVESNFIEGCETYNSDGTCQKCIEYYEIKNGRCNFKNQCGNYPVLEMCLLCEDGYYLASDRLYQCISYDGSKDSVNANDNAAKRIKITFVLIYLLLALI